MTINHPSFGTLDDDRIIIFDTTLRDGEQSPGFSMNLTRRCAWPRRWRNSASM